MNWWEEDRPAVAKAAVDSATWWEDDAPAPKAEPESSIMAEARKRVAADRSVGGVQGAFRDFIGEPLRQVARGTPLGTWSDEIEASLQGGLHGLTGGALGAPYDETLAYQRAYDQKVDEEYGLVGTGLKIGGAIAGTPMHAINTLRGAAAVGGGYGALAGSGEAEGGFSNRATAGVLGGLTGATLGGAIYGGARGVQAIQRARANQGEAGAYGAVAGDLPGGVDAFADEIAVGASRGNVTTNRRTLDILGEEMQRAGGDVRTAQQAAIARIAQEVGVTPQTAAGQIRRLTAVHENSPLMLGEYSAVSGSNAAQRTRQPGNIDLDQLQRIDETPTQGTLDYLANNGAAQSASDVRNALSRRQEGLAPAMRETIEGMAPRVQTGPRSTRAATIEDTAQNVENARQMARQEYNQAYATPTARPQRLQQLPRLFEYLSNRAATSAPEVAAVIRNAVNQVAVRLPDGTVNVQSLRQLQQGRTTLRGQMAALERQGRTNLAGEIRPLYRIVTRTMEDMSPAWATANRRWADMNFAELAQEFGDNFAEKAGPRFREQLQEFQGLAPEAQQIVRVHFLQKMYDKLDNLGDTHSISKLFATDHARRMIREMFGDDAVVSFTRAVRDQKVAERSQGMTQNSRTHMRGMQQKQRDSETGLAAAVENANARGVRNWLLERMTQMLTERRNQPLSRILTTPMSDTAQVAQHLARMRQQEQRLRQLDAPRPQSSRTLGVTGGQAGGGLGGFFDEQE